MPSFKSIRKPGTYKYSDIRCKVCQNHLNETNQMVKFKKFTGKLTATQCHLSFEM